MGGSRTEINNLILDLSRRDANQAPWHKDDSEGVFHNHIHEDPRCNRGLNADQNTRRSCFKLVSSQLRGWGGGGWGYEIVQKTNNEKEC